MKRINRWHWIMLGAAAVVLLRMPAASTLSFSPARDEPLPEAMAEISEGCSRPVGGEWIQRVRNIRWVAYSSPGRSPDGSLSMEAIQRDLGVLRKAGFSGLITYGSAGLMGSRFLQAAQEHNFKGVIVGIWDPRSQVELKNAVKAASLPIVMGYSIGNEGLSWPDHRYSIAELCSAMERIHAETGKPATTSEAIHVYYRQPELLWVGDWVFPNAHPYWHNVKYPQEAVEWQWEQYAALSKRTRQFIFFKEVGLPSRGAPGLSEENQDQYYRQLQKTRVQFAYFEGFDQPSKSHSSVEPHWGVFHANLSPKLLGWNLMGYRAFTPAAHSQHSTFECKGMQHSDCSEIQTGTLLVGKDKGGRSYQSLLAFNTSGIPDTAVITSIKLRLKVTGIKGLSPTQQGRHIMVDICRPAAPGLPSLEGSACVSNAGILDRIPATGWYLVEIEPDALQAINLEGETQFRLRIDRLPRAKRSYLMCESGGVDAGDEPVLVIRYSLP